MMTPQEELVHAARLIVHVCEKYGICPTETDPIQSDDEWEAAISLTVDALKSADPNGKPYEDELKCACGAELVLRGEIDHARCLDCEEENHRHELADEQRKYSDI